MKILVISDTHRNIRNLLELMKLLKNIDRIIHLGDLVSDAQDIQSIFEKIPVDYVAGNCDFFEDNIPTDKILHLKEKKIMLTHGHNHGVKRSFDRLEKIILKEQVDVLLFGHTHAPCIEFFGNSILFNPGSISEPRSNSIPSYGILEIDDKGKFHATINYLK